MTRIIGCLFVCALFVASGCGSEGEPNATADTGSDATAECSSSNPCDTESSCVEGRCVSSCSGMGMDCTADSFCYRGCEYCGTCDDASPDAAPTDVGPDTDPADVDPDTDPTDVSPDTDPTDVDSDAADSDAADSDVDPTAAACTASGGTVTTALCCDATDPFPDLCSVGACGCAPDFSSDIPVCDCPAGSCFDGTACVGEL